MTAEDRLTLAAIIRRAELWDHGMLCAKITWWLRGGESGAPFLKLKAGATRKALEEGLRERDARKAIDKAYQSLQDSEKRAKAGTDVAGSLRQLLERVLESAAKHSKWEAVRWEAEATQDAELAAELERAREAALVHAVLRALHAESSVLTRWKETV